MAEFNEKGEHIPDNTPVEIPVGFGVPEDLTSIIKRLVRVESQRAANEGEETFEESDDFDIEDEVDPVSNYAMTRMQEERRDEAKHIKDEENSVPDQKAAAADPDYQAFLAWKQAQAAQKISSETSAQAGTQ